MEPHNWRERQYKSDTKDPTNAERQQRYRDQKRNSNGVTAKRPDTDTDTDRVSVLINKNTNSSAREVFQEFWKAFPKRDGDNPKGKAEARFVELVESGVNPTILIEAARQYAANKRDMEPRYIPMAFTWLDEQRWEKLEVVTLPTIKPGQPEWEPWVRYYREHKKSVPLAMQRVLDGQQQAMTVPAKLPEQFDSTYAAALKLKQKLDERAKP
jgi:hypothetical protein